MPVTVAQIIGLHKSELQRRETVANVSVSERSVRNWEKRFLDDRGVELLSVKPYLTPQRWHLSFNSQAVMVDVLSSCLLRTVKVHTNCRLCGAMPRFHRQWFNTSVVLETLRPVSHRLLTHTNICHYSSSWAIVTSVNGFLLTTVINVRTYSPKIKENTDNRWHARDNGATLPLTMTTTRALKQNCGACCEAVMSHQQLVLGIIPWHKKNSLNSR